MNTQTQTDNTMNGKTAVFDEIINDAKKVAKKAAPKKKVAKKKAPAKKKAAKKKAPKKKAAKKAAPKKK